MFRLATFNLYQFCRPRFYWYERISRNTHSDRSWDEKRAWTAAQLRLIDADVVGFQEVFHPEDLEALVREAGYRHFEIVDRPAVSADDAAVMVGPVVAIASRAPIKEARAAPVDPSARADLPVAGDFRFSRTPLRAVVDAPGLGDLIVYVTHLKSKRPVVAPPVFGPEASWEEKTRETMRATSRGHAASLLQRGAEAALLYQAITEEVKTDDRAPVVVLGDLNDDPVSIPIEALTMRGQIWEIDEVGQANWPQGVKGVIWNHRLADAFDLAPHQRGGPRPATHYHRGEPGVLDYVMVSNALNERAPGHRGRVIRHEVFADHLDFGRSRRKTQSDHGQVAIDLEFVETRAPFRLPGATPPAPPTQEREPPAPRAPRPEGDIETRADFVRAAGGVFENRESYKGWSGSDKWDNFWRFFFDEEFGWVRSAYGAIPISTLYQKQKHSIEHIIPQSFMRAYLARRPSSVRRGATTNPFNFIAAERGLNSARGSFPFDMDGDVVKRPFRIDLNPEAYRTTGLDSENEWVIPSRTRGDIARAILYMVLVYEIDELYNRHFDELAHWAKVDPPTPAEIAYAEWVEARLGIKNPLIAEPARMRAILAAPRIRAAVTLAG